MRQLSFAKAEFPAKKNVIRRGRFLGEMEQIMPWAELVAVRKPHHFPDAGTDRGRRPIGLEQMLRIYCLQQWYALTHEALEVTVNGSEALRHFVGIDFGRESVPDDTTLLGFRHLFEANGLTATVCETINRHLRERGLLLCRNTLANATILPARPSSKNSAKARLRSHFEHPFHILKKLFGHHKLRYKCLAKNAQLDALFPLANLVIAKKALLSHCSGGAS